MAKRNLEVHDTDVMIDWMKVWKLAWNICVVGLILQLAQEAIRNDFIVIGILLHAAVLGFFGWRTGCWLRYRWIYFKAYRGQPLLREMPPGWYFGPHERYACKNPSDRTKFWLIVMQFRPDERAEFKAIVSQIGTNQS